MSAFDSLVGMGFDAGQVQQAIDFTVSKGGTLDDAVNWMLGQNNPVSTNDGNDFSVSTGPQSLLFNTYSGSSSCKLILVVRTDLQMSTGKIAAQCVHAALGLSTPNTTEALELRRQWQRSGETTICLKCGSEAELQSLRITAANKGA